MFLLFWTDNKIQLNSPSTAVSLYKIIKLAESNDFRIAMTLFNFRVAKTKYRIYDNIES